MLPNMANGALQLYAAAAAAQFGGPRSRVPTWAPFLQFGMPAMGMFGNSFLNRPRFGPSTGATVASPVANLTGCAPALPGHPMGAAGHMSRNTNTNSSNNSNLGAQSDDEDDDKGERREIQMIPDKTNFSASSSIDKERQFHNVAS